MFSILENYFKPEFHLTKPILISPQTPMQMSFCLEAMYFLLNLNKQNS